MDSSEKESGGEPTSILGLSEDDHGNQNISYEVGSALGTQRLHLEREPTVDIEEGSFSQQLTWITDKGIKMETNSEDEAEGSDSSCAMTRSNSYDELVRGGIMLKPSSPETTASPDSTRHFNSGDLQISVEEEEEVKDHAVVIHHMDIKEPLSTLRRSLEAVHNFNLEGYHFYLQNETQDEPSLQCQSSQILSPLPQDYCEQVLYIPSDSVMREYGSPTEPTDLHVSFQHALDMELYQFVPSLLSDDRSLEDQCHPGCGTVQINLEVKVMDDKKMLNIIDVLMPSDSYLQSTGNAGTTEFNLVQSEEVSQSNVSGDQDDKDAIRWTIDKNFKESQQRLQIPEDPVQWDVPQVLHWLVWAVRQFNLTGIDLADWRMTGAELCNLTLEEFQVRVPCDPFDIFWTHLELLRRCKMVAVMLDPITKLPRPASAKTREESDIAGNKNIMRTRDKKPKFVKNNNKTSVIVENSVLPLNGWIRSTGNNGQVQLWQFLLDLLTDKNHREVIQWLGGEGEFKLMDPERVAYLWGQRKNKPSMNYEKLSRALRYYYDGDMIAKVSGKRFVYKFVCDLKQLLGYSAFELNSRVIDAELRAQNAANDPPPLQHSIFRNP